MVPPPAFAAERLDAFDQRDTVADPGRQPALASFAIFRRTALERELGFVEPAARPPVAGGGGNPDSDGCAGRPAHGFRNPGHCADGDSAMVALPRKNIGGIRRSERVVALRAVLLGIALMPLVVVAFAMTAGLGFVSAANQANELRAYYLARSGVNIGLGLLAEDARADARSETPMDTLLDVWAIPYPTMPSHPPTASLTLLHPTPQLNINGSTDQNPPPIDPPIPPPNP